MSDDVKRRIQKERKLTASEADAVLELATRLQSEETGMGHLSQEDVREGAAEVGIDPAFVDRAMRELERERKLAPRREAERRRKLMLAAGVAVFVLVAGIGLTRVSLGGQLAEVKKAEAQLDNVMERRRALIPQLIGLAQAGNAEGNDKAAKLQSLADAARGELPERLATDAEIGTLLGELHRDLARSSAGEQTALLTRLSDEIAGAQNRISAERRRYDEAALAYNEAAASVLLVVFRPLSGMPADVPLSSQR